MCFREAIVLLHNLWVNTHSEYLASAAKAAPWYIVMAGPIIGGLIVGIILTFCLPLKKTGIVADVMEGKLEGGRPLSAQNGLISAMASAISLGFGASAGREGPVVHLGASLAASLAKWTNLPDWSARTLLACGAAGAVAASFNAPIAAVIFAHEVILGHYSRRSLVPIVLASVASTVVSHLWLGNLITFTIPNYEITSYWEFPAFALLGLVCTLIAISFQISLRGADYWARKINVPLWLRPVMGGVIIGAIGIFIPEILGVGYEPTDNALRGTLDFQLLIILIFAKIIATSITLASRFGGGVFSPALYIGAMTGGAYGIVAASILPSFGSEPGAYAILGMGAVAATIIGAPLSTVVIVFELTGNYTLTIAVLVCISVASGANQALHGRSFFELQLEMRGIFLNEGPHKLLLTRSLVRDFASMHSTPLTSSNPENGEQNIERVDKEAAALTPNDTLENALKLFSKTGQARLPVIEDRRTRKIIGTASHLDALNYYNKVLVEVSEEEHR